MVIMGGQQINSKTLVVLAFLIFWLLQTIFGGVSIAKTYETPVPTKGPANAATVFSWLSLFMVLYLTAYSSRRLGLNTYVFLAATAIAASFFTTQSASETAGTNANSTAKTAGVVGLIFSGVMLAALLSQGRIGII